MVIEGPIAAECFGALFAAGDGTVAGDGGVGGVGAALRIGAGLRIGSTWGPGMAGSSFLLFHTLGVPSL